MRAVVELLHQTGGIVEGLVLQSHFFDVFGILDADGFGEVSEGPRSGEIQDGRAVIGQDPGKDRILIQVVVGASSHGVQHHQIVEVRQLAVDPLLGELRLLEDLRGSDAHREIGEDALHSRQLQGDDLLVDLPTEFLLEVDQEVRLVEKKELQGRRTEIVTTKVNVLQPGERIFEVVLTGGIEEVNVFVGDLQFAFGGRRGGDQEARRPDDHLLFLFQ